MGSVLVSANLSNKQSATIGFIVDVCIGLESRSSVGVFLLNTAYDSNVFVREIDLIRSLVNHPLFTKYRDRFIKIKCSGSILGEF